MFYFLSLFRDAHPTLRLFQYITFRAVMGAGTAFVLALLLAPPVIRWLRAMKIRQLEADSRVTNNQAKKVGTPFYAYTRAGIEDALRSYETAFAGVPRRSRHIRFRNSSSVRFGPRPGFVGSAFAAGFGAAGSSANTGTAPNITPPVTATTARTITAVDFSFASIIIRITPSDS